MFVECPSYCGGPCADTSQLSVDQLDARRRHGCDESLPASEAMYAITCPRCGGSGCAECKGEPFPGFKPIRRCPGHYQSREVARFLRLYRWMKEHGTMLVPGGMLDQAAGFVTCVQTYEHEVALIRAEKRRNKG